MNDVKCNASIPNVTKLSFTFPRYDKKTIFFSSKLNDTNKKMRQLSIKISI